MTEEQLFQEAINAHEWAEQAALAALKDNLRSRSVDALACLADPSWRWETRSHLSMWIVEMASQVLDEKLEALVAA